MKVRVFTDGACSGNPGPGGWAALIMLPTKQEELSGYEHITTSNCMELRAACEAIRHVIKLGYGHIDLYSDSAYVVNAVKLKWIKKWELNGWKTVQNTDVKNREWWERLSKILKNHHDIRFIKVKGHSGNEGNERVDALARSEVEKHKATTI